MKRPLTPAVALAVALLALALGLSACGEKSEDVSGKTEPLSLTLDFYPNPDHAGIYMAQKLGYFEEAGLDVSLHTPSDPAAPIKLLAAGQTDLAISYEPEVLLAKEQGLDVLAVGALVNRPLTSMIWLGKSGVKGIGDLRGKTVATAGIPYQEDYLDTILDGAGLASDDVTQVDVGLNLLPALLSGRADAILGGFSNIEGVDLAERGREPRVVPVDQLGIPTYDELVLVANSDNIDNDPKTARLFIAALERGTREAIKRPDEATQAILDAGDGLDPKLTRAEIDRTLPLLSQKGTGHPFGYLDPREWTRFAHFMADNGLIKVLPSMSSILTNDLLPSQVP
jgi:putative hydroxymethylpyrimidine transport system substrate-binding protein